MIYLDNAATSFPKPKGVIEQLNKFVIEVGGNPGRSGHELSVEAARIIFTAREQLTDLIGGDDSRRLIFTQNGTEALNLAILGMASEGCHMITTSLEHNSVMRPLTFLRETRGVDVTVIPCTAEGRMDPDDFVRAIRKNTGAVIVNHGSNVIGTVQPLQEIKVRIGSVPLIVDACQTIGCVEIDVRRQGIDMLCFSGHKSLYSVQGVGALYMSEGIDPTPLKFGGTGSKSEATEQPDFLPDKYECGTPNTPGIASLVGGLGFIERTGLSAIINRKRALRGLVIARLTAIPGLHIYGATTGEDALPVLSINIEGKLPSEVGYELNRREIYVRVGLHCSPMAHRTIGTFPGGTVRVSPGYFTTDEEIDILADTLSEIARS
jgi:cysteine desulfurase family protein